MKQPSPTPKNRGLDAASDTAAADNAASDTGVLAQAAQLDATFLALARRVAVDDDPASELSLRQLRVCMALYEGPQSMSVLSRELHFSLSAMTQMADRLERAELVTRGFEGTDRRVRKLRLTPRARRMLRLRQEARIRRAAQVLEHMSAADRVGLLTALDSLRQAAAAVAALNGRPGAGSNGVAANGIGTNGAAGNGKSHNIRSHNGKTQAGNSNGAAPRLLAEVAIATRGNETNIR